VLVDLEGEIVEGVLAIEDVLVQQDPGAEKIRPLELGEGRVVFRVTVVFAEPNDNRSLNR
jgi:hypothetical protein